MRVLSSVFLKAAFGMGFLTVTAGAATLFDSGTTALAPGDPVQFGRLSRNGVISKWTNAKIFPGEISAATAYGYRAYSIAIPSYYPYVQITIDDISGSGMVFASAYLGSYSPNPAAPNGGLDINYLGDAGSSGNFFGTDPRAFQVVMPNSANVVVVVSDSSSAGAGLAKAFDTIVEGFTDTSFDDAVPTPEPVTLSLAGAGLLAIALFARLLTAPPTSTSSSPAE